MKRIRISLDAGCYERPEGPLARDVLIVFDNRGFSHPLDNVSELPVIGRLLYVDQHQIPYKVGKDEERIEEGTLCIDNEDNVVVEHEDVVRRNLCGEGRFSNFDYDIHWLQRYEGYIPDAFCDGNLAGCFCYEENYNGNFSRLVIKKGDYKRCSSFSKVYVLEE